MRKFLSILVVVALFAIAMVPSFAQDEPSIAELVVSLATGDEPEFTVLLAAVQAADPVFLEVLSDVDTVVTVFAPTDAAFVELLEALDVSAEDLLADTDLLNAVLAYHVVPGLFAAEDVVALDGAFLGTVLPGYALYVSVEDGSVYVDDSMVIMADVEAANGYVHVIDSVLIPDTDEAMEDMEMETVLDGSIVDIVIALASGDEPEFTILLQAVLAADPLIAELLSNSGPFTVFAPTDAAFAALLEALEVSAEDLLADTDLLTSVLLYHVLPGEFTTYDFFAYVDEEADELPAFATLLPGTVLQLSDDGVNDVSVIDYDIVVDNGVIHVIDGVLLP